MKRSPSNTPSALQQQLASETAASLGRLGREVEFALGELTALQTNSGVNRGIFVEHCAQLVWQYFVQREACGLRDQSRVIELLEIPDEVLRRVGAHPSSRNE